jgi:6-phospho-beta-glucosidase
MAAHWGVDPGAVELDHVGLNHLTWILGVRVEGRDVFEDLLADPSIAYGRDAFPPDLIRPLGALPSSYLRYYLATNEVLAEQRAGHSRAHEVAAIERDLLARYADPTLDRPPDLLARRGGAWYSDAAVALMAAVHADTGDVQVVNVRNDGALPDLPPEWVVEVSARIDADGAHVLPARPLAPQMRELVESVKAFELLTIEAATTGDRDIALRALQANPLVPAGAAAPLLDALLDANRRLDPRRDPGPTPPAPSRARAP